MDTQIKVLIVEDSKNDTEMIVRKLESTGSTVYHQQVYTKNTFIDALENQSWDIILCDYKMPEFNSFEALQSLQMKELDIPLLIVSGKINEEIAIEAMRKGAADYIMKNNLKRLIPAVEREIRDARIRHERRRIEMELREARAMLVKTFESLEEAVLVIEPGSRNIIDCNPAVERIFGYEREAIIGKNAIMLHVNETMYELFGRESLEKLNKNGVYYTEFRMRRKNGEIFPTENTVTEIQDNNGNRTGIVSVVRDITERKEAEEKLKQSEERFRKLIEHASDGFVLIDRDGLFKYASPAALKIFGYDESDDLSNFHPNDMTHPDDLPSVFALIEELMRNPSKIQNLQYRCRHKTGSWRWIESTFSNLLSEPGLEGIVINFRDITDRRALEEKLTLHSRLLDEIGEAVMATDLNGNIIYWNQTAESLYGWSPEEVIGKNVVNVTPSDISHKQAEDIMDSLKKGESWSGEFEVKRRDGSVFPAFVTNSPVISDSGELIGIIGVSMDISERKRAEEQIRFQASLLDQVKNGVVATNTEGEIVFWNEYAEELHGWVEDEVIGQPIDKLLLAGDNSVDVELYRKELEEKGEWSGELMLSTKNGSQFPAYVTHAINRSPDGRVIGTVAVSVDLTKQKIIEAEIKKSKHQLQLQNIALESAANAFIVTDSDGIIEWANPAFSKLTGYTVEELRGKKPNILKSGKMSDEFYNDLWNSITSGNVWTGEVINKRKDGTFYDERMIITPVKNANGRITHFVAMKEDITEQKSFQHQLFQTQKLESIGTLASGIAHDFNNILGIILGYCTLLDRSRADDVKFAENLKTIRQAINRGSNLVQQILTFARKTDVEYDVININTTVRELSQLLHETFPKSITIDLKLDKNVPAMVMDQTQLNQALLNLCVNARDAIQDNEKQYGNITIRTSYIAGDKLRRKFPEAIPDKYVLISVMDTGTGIDEAIRDEIFDPFYTTKGPDKGTGLGLSLVYGIVKTYKGFIDLESELGKGSTFTLYLPIYQDVEGRKKDEKDDVPVAVRGTETILIVEDEEMLRKAIEQILQNHGYQVMSARDGEQGVELYKEHMDKIALVVTDMGLPKMSGFELFVTLQKINPDVKTILASGFIEPGVSSELFKKGIRDIIRKPYDANEILQKVRVIIDM